MLESTVESSSELVIGLTEKKPIRVLHVDDEAGFLKVAKQCLEMQGPFEVETASSFEEAMKKMKEKRFDVIVSDYQMPGKDGLQFLKELRQKGDTIPFIMFTGRGRKEVAIKALNLGADRYLNKVGDPETVYGELAHSIRKAMERERAEETVKRSEEKYRSLFENAKDVIVLLDLKGNVAAINKAAVEYGFKKDKVIGKNMRNFIPKRYWPRLFKELLQLTRGKTVENRVEILTPKGKKLADYRSNPIIIDSKVVGVQTVLEDVTERKEVEQRYRDLVEMEKDIIYSLDVKGNITYVSPAVETVLGYRPEELTGKHYLVLIPEEWRVKTEADFNNLLKIGEITAETVLLDKEGQLHFVEYSSTVIKEDDEVVETRGIVRDITERKEMEEELRSSKDRLNIIFQYAPDAFYLNDLKGNFIDGNKAAEGLTGYKKSELIGKSFLKLNLLSRSQIPKAAKLLAQNALGKPTGPDEFVLNRKDGAKVTVEIRTYPVKIKGRTLVLGIARDITERKKADAEIRKSEEKYRGLVELAPDGIVTVDLKGVITSVNPAFLRLTCYSEDEIVGKHFTKLQTIRARDIPRYLKLMKPALRGKSLLPFEYPYVRKDGTIHWGEAHIGRLKKDGKTIGFQAILREITERKQAEEAVQESQQKFRQLFMGNPEAAVYVDPGFHVLDVNPRFTELFGYSLDKIKGKHINDIVVPQHLRKEADVFDMKAKGGHVYHDTFRKKKDGSLIPVYISAAPIIVEGQLTGYVGVYKDVSKLKKTELNLKETLEKLRVVGGLTRHDMRNKLSAITGNVFIAKQKLLRGHEAIEHLSEIESAIKQVQEIFEFARIYERLGMEELAYMNVEKTVGKAVSLFSDLHGVRVVNNCHGLTVLADSLLRQLFYNLIDNSLRHGETVTRIRVYYEEAGKDRLKLVYEDDGVGIPKAEKEKIFEEGYGKGTGYGLYLIRKICEVYSWTIRETGKQGEGVQFTMTLPKMGKSWKILYELH